MARNIWKTNSYMNARANMHKNDLTSAVYDSDAQRLLQIIGVNENTATEWALTDIASIFRHQMNAPLDFDLSAEGPQGATAGSTPIEGDNRGITTFGELFRHPAPPIELLKLSKGFFKRIVATHPKNSAEHQVAYVSYLLSVILARRCHGKRISDLKDSTLITGLDWALTQTWVEKSIHKVLRDARPTFGGC